MPKKAVAGGGTFLGKEDLLSLANAGGVILMYRVRQMEDFDGDNGPQKQILTHVAVIAPAARAGEFYASQGLISRAVVSKLVDEPNGTAVAARLVELKRGGNAYPGGNPPSEPEWSLVEALYVAEGVSLDDPDADTKLFKILYDRHKESLNGAVVAATESVKTSTTKTSPSAAGGRPADDDEPPF